MPIYEFRCKQCDNKFEMLVFKNDVVACPSCQSSDVNRLMSACGFVSKGSGGEVSRSSSSGSSCSSCSSSSCSSCGH